MDGFTNIIQSHLVVVDSAFFKAHKRYAALLVLPRWQDFLTTSSRPMQWARVMPREPMPRESSSNLDARCWTQHDVRSRDAYRKDLFIDCCSSARITWNTPFETGATEGVRRRSDLKRCQCALRSFCSSVFLLLLKLDCISGRSSKRCRRRSATSNIVTTKSTDWKKRWIGQVVIGEIKKRCLVMDPCRFGTMCWRPLCPCGHA